MTFDSLRAYLNNAGSLYGYQGSFDSCKLMIKIANGLVPVESAQIHIDEDGAGSIVLSTEVPHGNLG